MVIRHQGHRHLARFFPAMVHGRRRHRQRGVLPACHIPQIRDLGFFVADGKGFWMEVKRMNSYRVEPAAAGTMSRRLRITIQGRSCGHRKDRFRPRWRRSTVRSAMRGCAPALATWGSATADRTWRTMAPCPGSTDRPGPSTSPGSGSCRASRSWLWLSAPD